VPTVVFYEKPGCAGNAEQKAWLRAAGHDVVSRNLLTTAWTPATLRSFFVGLPVATWFNRAAPRVKSGAIVPEACDADTALAAMIADPLLIRRPLLEVDGERSAGFVVAEIDRWIGLGAVAAAAGDAERCRRDGGAPCPGA
jgi:nitrogenase-associated protein